jgi:hypothetical protein
VPETAGGWQYGERIADHGPLYVETDFTRLIREPCNAITAFLFVILALVWLYRLRGQYRLHPFTTVCLPILLIGGIGGTLFHAFRRHPIFFYMDVIPILVLVLLGAGYLWVRLRPRFWHLLGVLFLLVLLQLPFALLRETHYAIVAHYVTLATLILIPVAVTLVKTRFRHAQLIKLTIVCFGWAILFRFLDPLTAPILPGLGTHWLWHTLGAVTTALLAEYFFRLETEPLAPLP